MAHAHEKKGQPTWQDLKLKDLRHVTELKPVKAPNLIKAGNSQAEAIQILLAAFGLSNEQESTYIKSCIGNVNVHGHYMGHIAEKRQDARERYVYFAIEVMDNPYEIWEITYEQDADLLNPAREFNRLAFIGFFQEEKNQMLVTIDTIDGDVLWNFMQQEKKSLNKHRHGKLIYSRI
jgi:hypothetical protein